MGATPQVGQGGGVQAGFLGVFPRGGLNIAPRAASIAGGNVRRLPGRLEHEAMVAELPRTKGGCGRVATRGVMIQLKQKRTAQPQREAIKRRDVGEPMREIARTYIVSHSTISRLTA